MNSGYLNKYYEVLDLDPEASLLEVQKTYRRLKELYSADSPVTAPRHTTGLMTKGGAAPK